MILFVVCLAGAFRDASDLIEGRDASVASEFAACLVVFSVCGLLLACHARNMANPRIVLYYSEELGDAETFEHGAGIALRIHQIDELLSLAGMAPLSDFGFADDYHGEELAWYPAESVLRSVAWLLEHPNELSGACGRRTVAVREDLEHFSLALNSASHRGIRVCLLLRLGGGRRGTPEMQVRAGSFW
jgi:hypothetical protein